MCPFCEISSLRCIAFSAIFNISKLVLCVCGYSDQAGWEKEGRRKQREKAGKTGASSALSKIKISFGQTEWALSRSSRGGFAIVSRKKIPETIYWNGVPGIRGSKP